MSNPAIWLAQFIFGNDSLAGRLEKSSLVQAVAQKLRARSWINGALARRPLRRRLNGSGVKYQIETFEALSVERMYFGNPVYSEIFSKKPPSTFIDLGCNSGMFPCFLVHLAKGANLSGLCVDANAEQIALAKKTAETNGWKNIHYRQGLVGSSNADANETEFFLHPTSLGSSQFAYTHSESGRPQTWKSNFVPNIKVADTWAEFFGPDLRCHCLKIDIEGSEMNFLRSEVSFLRYVDSILIEWHGWTCTRDEVVTFLGEHGFDLNREVERTPNHGVLYLTRSISHSGELPGPG